jgi:hypothetical protein
VEHDPIGLVGVVRLTGPGERSAVHQPYVRAAVS